jgi:hypothetical protein
MVPFVTDGLAHIVSEHQRSLIAAFVLAAFGGLFTFGDPESA